MSKSPPFVSKPLPDAATMPAIDGADAVSVVAFVERHQHALLRPAYLLAGDRGHAEDLVQTASMTTYRARLLHALSGGPVRTAGAGHLVVLQPAPGPQHRDVPRPEHRLPQLLVRQQLFAEPDGEVGLPADADRQVARAVAGAHAREALLAVVA